MTLISKLIYSTLAVSLTALTMNAEAGRPMRGVPTTPKKPVAYKKWIQNSKFLKRKEKAALELSKIKTNQVQASNSCRTVPMTSSEPMWIPFMYVEPSDQFKGVYLPLVSEGMIATNPQALAEAKAVWPKSSKQWMAIAELDYTSSIFDLESSSGISKRDAVIGIHSKVINQTEADYNSSKKVAKNYKSESILNASDQQGLQDAYLKYSESAGADSYNASLCDRFLQPGETNDGIVLTAKSSVTPPSGQTIDDSFVAVSSSLYLISDLYGYNGQDGIVGFDRKRTFIIGYSRNPSDTTHVLSCNLCKPAGSPGTGNSLNSARVQ